MSRARTRILLLSSALLAPLLACVSSVHPDLSRVPAEHLGVERFVLDDFGGIGVHTLETNALPYKLLVGALALLERQRSGQEPSAQEVPALLERYGFVYPERIANWPIGLAQPRFARPLGMVSGEVVGIVPPLKVDAVNLGCAACHAGRLYDREGRPTREVWLGLPNTSIDLEAYTRDVYAGLKLVAADPRGCLALVERLFPGLDPRERSTLSRTLLPRVQERMRELEAGVDAPAPFSNGGPGLTNGVAALKLQLGLLSREHMQPEYGFTSIPELGERRLRSSLLCDGLYTPRDRDLAAVVALFTVPTMGMRPESAERAIPEVSEVLRWLLTDYRSPPFPGPIDTGRAERGRAVYARSCASCHGETSRGVEHVRLLEFPNRLSPQAEIGSSSARLRAVDERLLRAIEDSAIARHAAPAATGGYVAPILSGLWATAPYLHNGSVPTLWHLMHPSARPRRFEVGGHRLDWEKVGIAGRLNERQDFVLAGGTWPWSKTTLYDTSTPGRENQGHEREFEALSEYEKADLLEYLKLL